MTQSDKPLIVKAHEWLEKSGLPLEMRVAQAFRDAGFEVTQGHGYLDAEEKKGREIDVLAHDHDKLGLLHFLHAVECKSSDKPWLVLKAPEGSPMNRGFAFGMTSDSVTAGATHLLLKEHETYRFACGADDAGYGFREIFSDGKDRAYAAAMSAANACSSILASERYGSPRLVFAQPVIVVDTPLFEAHLGSDGHLSLNEVTMSQFLFYGSGTSHYKCLARVVTKDAIERFAKGLIVVAKNMKKALQPEVDRWVQSTKEGRQAAHKLAASHLQAESRVRDALEATRRDQRDYGDDEQSED